MSDAPIDVPAHPPERDVGRAFALPATDEVPYVGVCGGLRPNASAKRR